MTAVVVDAVVEGPQGTLERGRERAGDATERAAAAPTGRRRRRAAGSCRTRTLPRARGRRYVVVADREQEAERAEQHRGGAAETRARAGRSRSGRPTGRGVASRSRRSGRRRRRSTSAGSAPPCTRRSRRASARRGGRGSPGASSSHCHRSAMGSAVTIMIVTASRNHQGLAALRTSHVCGMSIFSRTYASAALSERGRSRSAAAGSRVRAAGLSASSCGEPCVDPLHCVDDVEDVVVRVGRRERQGEHLVPGTLGDREGRLLRGSARGTTSADEPAGSGCSSPISSSESARWYSSRVAPARSASIRTT